MPFLPMVLKAGAGMGRPITAVAEYSFARDGGAQGAIPLVGDKIPNGAVVIDALISVEALCTSAGSTATIALSVQSAADLQTAAVVSGAPFSTTGPKRCNPMTATATPIAITAERTITATVAVQALTAGKFKVTVTYVVVPV
jgi:hypothetical protein